jgi:hypothetical protein
MRSTYFLLVRKCTLFLLLNQLADFHETWYAIGGHPNVMFIFLQLVNNNMANPGTCEVAAALGALHLGS